MELDIEELIHILDKELTPIEPYDFYRHELFKTLIIITKDKITEEVYYEQFRID